MRLHSRAAIRRCAHRVTQHRDPMQLYTWLFATTGLMAGLTVKPTLSQAQNPATLLGRWHGHSVCIKAAWNTSCHSERVVYDLTRSETDSQHISLHASKVVNGKVIPMGDLDLAFMEFANSWGAEYTDSRLHFLWQYSVNGTRLIGRLVELSPSRVVRRVTATR